MIVCPICQRETPPEHQEEHHLIPKSKKGKETVRVCHDCGNQVHLLFTLKELQEKYNTVESLMATPEMQKWVEWAGKQKYFRVCSKVLKKRKGKGKEMKMNLFNNPVFIFIVSLVWLVGGIRNIILVKGVSFTIPHHIQFINCSMLLFGFIGLLYSCLYFYERGKQ